MFEAEQICPYTGLRSFTEDESLYFKGRDENIDQATEQLQRNKFLMLTGASGDGKSSLIYAGIIPNARAGFLKSRYTNWAVADFRPERSPFHNLCKAIARQLQIDNINTIQSELQHGFSAIVDLYRNSKRYTDTESIVWQHADAAGKAALKREAANLLILVDQFEEFFTNPENYHKGVPSGDANLVLNLLLETARIAYEEDLPIYIVFTMRSDYIGQCAAFRGLPEYIGFSQFFVPRLNRTQLQHVIEEPAVLSGNRITRRLSERLIYDLTEGVDQLPILQHALNQIWHAADNGKEEMDLIHYAMVGGMPLTELPEEQVDRFKKWFENLPPEIKACYHKPNLQNVLDTHTNKLYEQAAEYYKQTTGKSISDTDAKQIIKTSFICLTKIDQSRAVRNRMTLKEITNILGKPELGTEEVGAVLNIFREPGNTFIHPFILEDPETHTLQEDDILDITHESLIRNWEYLKLWAKEEFDNYNISLDFEQQLKRWVESGKSKNFLLPIGPLTYFENWYNTSKPNAYWIARYLPEDVDYSAKLNNAKQVLENAQEFLKRSARKHTVTRTIMRYGAKRIAVMLGVILLLTLTSFAVKDFLQQQNDYVLSSIKKETLEIANISKLGNEFVVPAITEQLYSENITIPEVIDGIKESKQKIKIATAIATQLIAQGRNEPKHQILKSLTIADSLLNLLPIPQNNSKALSEGLKLLNDFRVTAAYAFFYNRDKEIQGLIKNNAKRSMDWAMQILQKQPDDFNDITQLTLALENAINHKTINDSQIDTIIKILSPFELSNTSPSQWVNENFHRNKQMIRGTQNYAFKFNSLYQQLAYLYATKGNSERVLQCIDSLLFYNQNYYQNDYTTMSDNASNIAAVFLTYGRENDLENFVKGYSIKAKTRPNEFYDRAVARGLNNYTTFENLNFYGSPIYTNLNLKFSDDSIFNLLYKKFNEATLKIKDSDERNFQLALNKKNQGIQNFYRKEIQGKNEFIPSDYSLYKEAIQYYQVVSDEFLDRSVNIVSSTGSDMLTMPARFLFLYPDFRVPFHPFEPRSFMHFHTSPSFVDYILSNGLFDSLYKSDADLKYFELWFSDYQVHMSSKDWMMRDPISFEVLEKLADKLNARKADSFTDLNILYLHLSNTAFVRGDIDKGIYFSSNIQPSKILNAFRYKGFGFVNSYSLEILATNVAHLVSKGHFDKAYQLINVFKKQINRSSIYAFASQYLSLNNKSANAIQRLLDSASVEMKRIDNPSVSQPNRHQVSMGLMYHNPVRNSDDAYKIIKNSFNKFEAISRFSLAYAYHNNLYKAKQQVPDFISPADKAFFLYNMMKGFNLNKELKQEWVNFRNNENIFMRRFLRYVNENE
ncbi:MAG: hypothetical protein ACR2KB_16105 [Chitinophagaceae bacterium]